MDLIKKLHPISDDYKIENDVTLGQGLNGSVHSCINKATNERYAVKVYKI